MKIVDLRSDTLTLPTKEMRHAMSIAEVGDDVYGEDPSINRLEEMAAALTGKEAALFVVSGTQGNQVAIHVHTRPGQEIVAEQGSHIFNYESGASAMLSGVQVYTVQGQQGIFRLEQLREAIRPTNFHYPQTGLICLENTHNRAGGTIYPFPEIQRISQFAREKQIPLHMDGARLWNASAVTGIAIDTYCQYVDSVMLCFSKGLGAPVGSVVAGSKPFIEQARYYRKAYGGGVRQGGILAAAAIYALEHHLPQLSDDHRRARWLAEEIARIPQLRIHLETVQTNIVIFEVEADLMNAEQLVEELKALNVLMLPLGSTAVRTVVYSGISDEDIEFTLTQLRKVVKK